MKKIILILSLFFLAIPSGCNTANPSNAHAYTISMTGFGNEWISISGDGKYLFRGFLRTNSVTSPSGVVSYYSSSEALKLAVEVSYRVGAEQGDPRFVKETESREFFRSDGIYFEIHWDPVGHKIKIGQSSQKFLYK